MEGFTSSNWAWTREINDEHWTTESRVIGEHDVTGEQKKFADSPSNGDHSHGTQQGVISLPRLCLWRLTQNLSEIVLMTEVESVSLSLFLSVCVHSIQAGN